MNVPHELHDLQSPALCDRFIQARAYTMALVAPLSAEDCCVQSMPDASPVKWHLAHTTWFFETFILERYEPGFVAHHPAFRVLFNSYYVGIGERAVRSDRGMLTRPSHAEVLAYRAAIDARVAALFTPANWAALSKTEREKLSELVVLGLQHEAQHQELILTDVKHLLSLNPLQPAYRVVGTGRDANSLVTENTNSVAPSTVISTAMSAEPIKWLETDAGIVHIGHQGNDFCFDNETPRHRQFVEAFALASRLTTNGEYLNFVEQGGYQNPSLWLAEGWDWIQANKISQPLYWHQDAAQNWQEFTFDGTTSLNLHAPLVHISLYEAEAYARWAGCRLPTEAEWECTVADGSNSTPQSLFQLYDVCWQWTISSYAPYPGYAPVEGALGEYNGKFMINQYVLKGGSAATASGYTRASYRNFFPASTRWQLTGIRLARSI